jgi:hypothetical protein
MTAKIELQVLSGPLDGANFVLTRRTLWSRIDDGCLSFPWDTGLSSPQASFLLQDATWVLRGAPTPHGTYRVNTEEKVTEREPIELVEGDILKASKTWLLVVDIRYS